jgi:hypothetical protein
MLLFCFLKRLEQIGMAAEKDDRNACSPGYC